MSTVSSLSRIDTLRRHLSANPGDKEAWLQLEATLRRSGQDPSEVFEPLHALAMQADDQAELDKFSAALAVNPGARVRYTNKRARAKFARGGQLEGTLVPHGTEGEVFWTGRNYSDWILKLGIRTDNGEAFFTSARHCSDKALNAYARWRGVDAATLREKDKARKAQKDADKVREVFGEAGPKQGQRVRLRGFEGKIAWVGACRKSNRTRVGVKRLLSERDMGAWGYASECEVIQ